MKKLGIISDLHIRSWPQQQIQGLVKRIQDSDEFDTLVVAGDVDEKPEMREEFLEGVSKSDKEILYVPGNHDYYWNIIPGLDNGMSLTDDYVSATLWTNFADDPICELAALNHIMDFRVTAWKNKTKFNTEHCKQLYDYQRNFIFDNPRPLVVTHFAPTLQSIHEYYLKYVDESTRLLNRYFVNSLENQIQNNEIIKLWIHGHTHNAFDYMVGQCRVVCNPLGYRRERYNNVADYPITIMEYPQNVCF